MRWCVAVVIVMLAMMINVPFVAWPMAVVVVVVLALEVQCVERRNEERLATK